MFDDRKDAAIRLARALKSYRDRHVLVLGIPRGGMETAFYVAQYLRADFAPVISRKLAYLSDPETAFGAIAEDGSTYISPEARQHILDDEMEEVISEQKKEILKRVGMFRHGKPLPELNEKTVILVDDGIATGSTLFATIQLCKNKNAGKIVVASPIASASVVIQLRKLVDDVVVLEVPLHFESVSQGYKTFRDLTNNETLSFLESWEREHSQNLRPSGLKL